ncbi:MAG TPA: DUF4912 domain-containing protein [Polyangia bacterium]|nr:DUF4912 domain-containing protein [Polyangia bacterium]
MPEETTSADDLAAQILLVLGSDLDSPRDGAGSAEAFRRCSRDQLLECARRLGLTKVMRLTKEALARRIQQAFDKLPRSAAPANGARATAKATAMAKGKGKNKETTASLNGGGGNGVKAKAPVADAPPDVFSSFPSKFDLGPGTEQSEPPRNIPWGYGQDRVTAMVVDPERMFVYWEVTDDAIARARRDLGRGGDGAWLNLRVYDVTGRLFDGTNAHSYFDHKIERSDRQWFFEINKPTSMNCVEVGLRSTEGYFVKIARSGRVEFPRREPVGAGHVEWLTVRTASGHAGDPVAGGLPPANVGAGADGAIAGGGQQQDEGSSIPGWTSGQPLGDGQALAHGQTIDRRWEWREGERGEWQSQLESMAWTGPVVRTTWEAGPFSYPIEAPTLVEERNQGRITTRTTNGQVHVVYGPWQVVIRGVGARAERRVLATWEVYHSWATTTGGESKATQWRQLAPGSSEWVALGASERSWMFGSELRLGGASEIFFRGASELLYAGASERLYAGASERLYAGASERLYAGASERARDYPAGVGASEAAPPRQYPERR